MSTLRRQTDASCSRKRGRMPPVESGPRVPVLGGPVAKIVPAEEHEAFLAFAKEKIRLFALVVKNKLTPDEERNIRLGYEAFKKERTSTALIKSDAAALAPVLSMKTSEVARFLEDYTTKQITALAAVAQELGTEPKHVIRIDHALMMDGSYIRRSEETKAVAQAHARIVDVIRDEITKHHVSFTADEDYEADQCEATLLKEYKGNQRAADEAYIKKMMEKLLAKKQAAIATAAKFKVSEALIVEIFKLLNYNTSDIEMFAEYFEQKFSLDKVRKLTQTELEDAIKEVVMAFVYGLAGELVLNSRSELHAEARRAQIKGLKEKGLYGPLNGLSFEISEDMLDQDKDMLDQDAG